MQGWNKQAECKRFEHDSPNQAQKAANSLTRNDLRVVLKRTGE
jgi:hypothetical protein